MTKDELRNLWVGARVRWVSPGGSADGEVVERLKGNYYRIRWEDGHTEILNWRSGFDRHRARNIVLVDQRPDLTPPREEGEHGGA